MLIATAAGKRPSERSYDVVVVGAGPGGAAAAFYAASGGLSTLLIDRKRFPRSKVCGDGLTPRALRALDRMGIAQIASGHQIIEGVRFVSHGVTSLYSYEREYPPFTYGAVVPRVTLDDRVRRAAERAGAEFTDCIDVIDVPLDGGGSARGVEVEADGDHHLITAAVTIIADGAAGRIGRRLRGDVRLPALAARCYLHGVEELDPWFEFRAPIVWQGRAVVGYSWIFPVAPRTANVGLGIVIRQRAFDERMLRMALSEFVAELRAREPRFARAEQTGPIEGGPLNSRMSNVFLAPDGTLLVGDAAGLVNVFTGEGISYALESGELAARAARASIRRSVSPTARYARMLVATYPRHWALRGSPRHLRWILSMGPSLVESERPPGVIGALQALVLDGVPRIRGDDRAAPPASSARATRRLLKVIRSRALRGLRRQDRILGEVGDALFSAPASPVLLPLVVAGALLDPGAFRDGPYLNALTAVALFTLAHHSLDAVERITGRNGWLSDTAAILIGDCITTEAARALAALPDAYYGRISSAFREAARMHVARSDPALPASPEAEYAALAAPVSCAAAIALRSRRLQDDADETIAWAGWYGATRLAAAELPDDPSARLIAYLRVQLEHGPGLAISNPALNALTFDLCSHLRTVLDATAERVSRTVPR